MAFSFHVHHDLCRIGPIGWPACFTKSPSTLLRPCALSISSFHQLSCNHHNPSNLFSVLTFYFFFSPLFPVKPIIELCTRFTQSLLFCLSVLFEQSFTFSPCAFPGPSISPASSSLSSSPSSLPLHFSSGQDDLSRSAASRKCALAA